MNTPARAITITHDVSANRISLVGEHGALALSSDGTHASIALAGDVLHLDAEALAALGKWINRLQAIHEITAAAAQRDIERRCNQHRRTGTPPKLYMSLGEEVLCTDHIGAEAAAQIAAHPRKKRIETTMTVWKQIDPDAGLPCETCDRKKRTNARQ